MTTTPRVYLLDVEGTIAPISLVSDQLFPFARAHFANFLDAQSGDAAVRSDLMLLVEESLAETEPGAPRIPEFASNGFMNTPDFQVCALAYLLWLMDRDRKSTALKSLQGKIWKAGFESGELKGTLFADVLPALQHWAAHDRVAIYSSGSVSAQQLLFRYSIFGDISKLISAYFDTRTGAKTVATSYAAIAADMQVEPQQVCFFSDVVRELDAAREAGLDTRLVLREGNAPVEEANGHAAIRSLDRGLDGA